MEIIIRNIDIIRNADGEITDIHVRYDSQNIIGFSVNGYVKLSSEEYFPNASDLDALSVIVKNKLLEKLANA